MKRFLVNIVGKRSGRFNQILLASMVNIPTLSYGMFMGWTSPMQPLIQKVPGPLATPASDDDFSWIASIMFLTSLPLELVLSYVADNYGRKPAILLTSFSIMICNLITLVATRPWELLVARGLGGFGCAGVYVIVPLYIKEISEDQIRGALGSMLILAQNFGYLVIYLISDIFSYNVVNWISFIIPLVHFAVFFVMPETPNFLMKKLKREECEDVLSWLRGSNIDDKKLQEEMKAIELESSGEFTCMNAIRTVFENKTTLKAFRIASISMLIQESCGYLIVLLYAGYIFEKAAESSGINLSPNQQAIVLGALQFVGSIVASSLVEKTGRKLLLATTSCITGLSMLSLGTWFYMTESNVLMPAWLPLTAMGMSIFCDAAGFQPVPYVIMSELFSFQVRGIVTAVIIAGTSFMDFVQAKAFGPLTKAIGIHSTFWLFSIICFMGTVYTVLCVPETRGKSLEAIYATLDSGKCKTKNIEIRDNENVTKF